MYILYVFSFFIVDTQHWLIVDRYIEPFSRTCYFLFLLFDIHVRVVDTNQTNLSFTGLALCFCLSLLACLNRGKNSKWVTWVIPFRTCVYFYCCWNNRNVCLICFLMSSWGIAGKEMLFKQTSTYCVNNFDFDMVIDHLLLLCGASHAPRRRRDLADLPRIIWLCMSFCVCRPICIQLDRPDIVRSTIRNFTWAR